MTLPEIARHAAHQTFLAFEEDGRQSFEREVADAVLIAVLQEIKKLARFRFGDDSILLRDLDALLGVLREGQQSDKKEDNDLSRSDQPQLRAGEADPRDDHGGRP